MKQKQLIRYGTKIQLPHSGDFLEVLGKPKASLRRLYEHLHSDGRFSPAKCDKVKVIKLP